jgi:hypothetical protein
MEFFTLLLMFLGIIGGVVAIGALFSPGIAELLGQFINFLVSSVQEVVKFLVNNLPRPLKILIVLLLFVSLGGLIYSVTIGSQYVCYNKDVYKTDIVTGWSLRLLPGIDRVSSGLKGSEKFSDVRPTSDLSVAASSPVVYRSNAVSIDSSNFVRVAERSYTDDVGDTYVADVYHILVSAGDVMFLPSLGEIFSKREVDRLQSFFGFSREDYQYVVYDVCRDRSTNTCILQRQTVLGVSPCGFLGSGSWVETWNNKVGHLYYMYERDSSGNQVMFIRLDDQASRVHDFVEKWFGVTTNRLSSCVEAPSRADLIDLGVSAVALEMLSVPPVVVNVEPSDGDVLHSFPLYLYDAQFGAVLTASTPRNVNQQFVNLSQQPLFDERDFSQVVGVTSTRVSDLLADSKKLGSDGVEYGVVSFVCDDSDSAYKTKLLIANINPFDPLVLLFIFLIGGVVSVYSKLGVFK